MLLLPFFHLLSNCHMASAEDFKMPHFTNGYYFLAIHYVVGTRLSALLL